MTIARRQTLVALVLLAALPCLACADEIASPSLPEAALVAASSAPPPDAGDDPKAARAYQLLASAHALELPSAKLSYRSFVIPNVDGTDIRLHGGQVDIYGLSKRGYRLGVDIEIGAGRATVAGVSGTSWYITVGGSFGFQWPWRVTPFVDLRFVAGFLGGQVPGKPQLTYIFSPGIDAGFEVYLTRRYYLSFALGWMHPVYRGVDYAYQMAHPAADSKFGLVQSDSLTFKFGVGM